MAGPNARERTVAAAYELFEEQGYDGTTVDHIAERARVGRTTFFRMFGSKEDVIFPEHDDLTDRIDARLAVAGARTQGLAAVEAARTVLDHYLAEGDLARARYRLTRTVPALRAREIAGMQRYQLVFRTHMQRWLGDEQSLRAELWANAVVTAHNHVLRRWLRQLTEDPYGEFDAAMAEVHDLFSDDGGGVSVGATVVVVPTGLSADRAADLVRAALSS